MNFTETGTLSAADSMWLFQNHAHLVRLYNNLQENIATTLGLSDLELLTPLLSRDPSTNAAIDVFLKAHLLRYKISRGEDMGSVIISDEWQRHLIMHVLGAKPDVDFSLRLSGLSRFLKVTKILRNFFASLYSFTVHLVLARIFAEKEGPTSIDCLIDLFISPESFDSEGNFVDRYYHLHDNLKLTSSSKLWIQPFFVGDRNPFRLYTCYRNLKNCEADFLLAERWMGVADLVHAFSLSLSVYRKSRKIRKISPTAVNRFLELFARPHLFSPSMLKVTCRARFLAYLSENHCIIKRAIVWGENQECHKAFVKPLRQSSQSIQVVAYQGFLVSDYFMCGVPTPMEIDKQLTPKVYIVASKYSRLLQYQQLEIEVIVGPAFRFEFLKRIKRNIKVEAGSTAQIIIMLSIRRSEYFAQVQAAITLSEMFQDQHITIKAHPASSARREMSHLTKERPNVSWSELPAEVLYPEADAIVTSGLSSSCVEAVELGIPVAVYCGTRLMPLHPIPPKLGRSQYKVCFTADEVAAFIGVASGGAYSPESGLVMFETSSPAEICRFFGVQ